MQLKKNIRRRVYKIDDTPFPPPPPIDPERSAANALSSDLSSGSTRDSIYALGYLVETRAGAMPLWQYVHSVFDSPTLFRQALLLGKYVAMLSRRTTGKNPASPFPAVHARAALVCSVLFSNKVTPRCNPEFVRGPKRGIYFHYTGRLLEKFLASLVEICLISGSLCNTFYESDPFLNV